MKEIKQQFPNNNLIVFLKKSPNKWTNSDPTVV